MTADQDAARIRLVADALEATFAKAKAPSNAHIVQPVDTTATDAAEVLRLAAGKAIETPDDDEIARLSALDAGADNADDAAEIRRLASL